MGYKNLKHNMDYGKNYYMIVSSSFAPNLKKDMIVGKHALMISKKCPSDIRKKLLHDFPLFIDEFVKNLEKIY